MHLGWILGSRCICCCKIKAQKNREKLGKIEKKIWVWRGGGGGSGSGSLSRQLTMIDCVCSVPKLITIIIALLRLHNKTRFICFVSTAQGQGQGQGGRGRVSQLISMPRSQARSSLLLIIQTKPSYGRERETNKQTK